MFVFDLLMKLSEIREEEYFEVKYEVVSGEHKLNGGNTLGWKRWEAQP